MDGQTVISTLLHPLSFDRGSYAGSSPASSTVGDYVRSPGTVRFLGLATREYSFVLFSNLYYFFGVSLLLLKLLKESSALCCFVWLSVLQ